MKTPAEIIIEMCGGAEAVAAMIGRHHTRVRRWTYPKERGGTGGLIPGDLHHALLESARARGIDLRPEHFFRGDLLPAPAAPPPPDTD